MTKLGDITQTVLGQESPPVGAYAITPNNDADLPVPIRGFMVTVAGNVNVQFWDGAGRTGDTAVLPACQPGVQYAGLIKKVFVTNTTATGIVGLK